MAHRTVFVEVADWRIAAGLGLPATFQAAVVIEPMTGQRRGWNPALALRAANTRKVVIGMGIVRGIVEEPGPAQRNAPRLQRPESSKSEGCKSEVCKPEVCKSEVCKSEVSKSGYCESFEHRSPPLPLCAAGQ
jgi:hypothetical protein